MRFVIGVLLVFACRSLTMSAKTTEQMLDRVITDNLAIVPSAAMSVLVAEPEQLLFAKSYGYASIGLGVPATNRTVYHIIGPLQLFTAVAVMQLVERGQLSLDRDVGKLVPELATHRERISIRGLLGHTAGIPDFHYLGDAYEGTVNDYKTGDQILALVTSYPLTHDPGTQFDWSVTNFEVMARVIASVSGQTYPEYMCRNLFEPVQARTIRWCDGSTEVSNLASSYQPREDGLIPSTANVSSYDEPNRFCGSAEDVYKIWRGIWNGKLIRPATWKQMRTPISQSPPPRGSLQSVNLGTITHRIEERLPTSNAGALLNAGSAVYEFEGEDLTIIVLSNTGGWSAHIVAEQLARRILGFRQEDIKAEVGGRSTKDLADEAVVAKEQAVLSGTYQMRVKADKQGIVSFPYYRRTYRVFSQDGHLMIQAWGDVAEPLLKQKDGTFSIRSFPTSTVMFPRKDGSQLLSLTPFYIRARVQGTRVGQGDAETFQRLGCTSDQSETIPSP